MWKLYTALVPSTTCIQFRDVLILEFLVASAFASALPATVMMFKISWNPGLVFNNVACAKNFKCNLGFCSIVVTKN